MEDKKNLKAESLNKVAGGYNPDLDLYCCPCCGYVYDPDKHDGVPFSTYDSLWECPYCSTFKFEFIRM